MNPLLLQVSGLVLVAVAAVLHIVCFATPYYVLVEFYTSPVDQLDPDLGLHPVFNYQGWVDQHVGVWETCFTVKGEKTCLEYGENNKRVKTKINAPDWLKAVQALGIIGIVVAGAGVKLSVFTLVKRTLVQRWTYLPAAITGVLWFGALVLVIGNVVFAAEYIKGREDIEDEDDLRMRLDWGFYIDIVACVFVVAGGLLHLFWGRSSAAKFHANNSVTLPMGA